EVLCSSNQREGKWQTPRGFSSRGHAFNGVLEGIDWVRRIATRILNRCTDQARDLCREANGLSHDLRRMPKAVLEIRRYREISGVYDRPRIGECLVSRQQPKSIRTPKAERQASAS